MRASFKLFLIAAEILILCLSTSLSAQPCVTPDAPKIIFTPPGEVGVGQTYSVVWSEVANLDDAGIYAIDRASDAAFSAIVDSQQTTSTSATFIAASEQPKGYFHRVRAIAGCDPNRTSVSAPVVVFVTPAKPNVVFTVQPAATVLAIGDKPSTRIAPFVIENITKSTVTAAIAGAPIASPQFFLIVDPQGELEASGSITLSPRQTRRLEIHFLDVPTTGSASYQGFVFVAGQPVPLAVTPYAFVNLKVGSSESSAPLFRFQGMPSEYAFFPGYLATQPDAARPSITVQIENPGSTPMDLGGEIAPEAWLVPEAGWNAKPIPPKQRIDVKLFVDRSRALRGSALPRYTYFTVRSKGGQSARLLVQDNDSPAQSTGRAMLDPAIKSYVVPRLINSMTAAGHSISRVRISNAGGGQLNADLFFTPEGADGLNASQVRRATVVVPPNDVVNLTDPLGELFGLAPPVAGQLEVRAPADRVAFLSVTSETIVAVPSGGTFSYGIPVAKRGEGARIGSAHNIGGLTAMGNLRRTLILAETGGLDSARGHVTVYDQDGKRVGDVAFFLAPNGEYQFDDIVNAAGGGSSFTQGRLELIVDLGSGSAIGNLVLIDPARQKAAVIPSQPVSPVASAMSLSFRGITTGGTGTSSYVIPGIVNGNPSGVPSVNLATVVGLSAPSGSSVTYSLTYLDAFGFLPKVIAKIVVDPGKTIELPNVLENIFGLPTGAKAQGTLLVGTSKAAPVTARVTSGSGSPASLSYGALPVISNASEALTAASVGSKRPVFIDGLEQSVDPSRGKNYDFLISEVSGKPAVVTVRLFEAGNRSSPIAEKTYTLAPHQQLRLAPLFKEMGLQADDRLKDRTNVEAMILPESGDGTVVTVAISTDNQTHDTSTYLLTPSGGVPASGISKVAAVKPPPLPPHRRAVNH